MKVLKLSNPLLLILREGSGDADYPPLASRLPRKRVQNPDSSHILSSPQEDEKQSNKRRTAPAAKPDDSLEAQLKRALGALKKTMQIADAEPFNVPVDAKGLGIPDYLDVVKSPMDYGTIRTKLEKGEYAEVAEMLKDVRQVSENCRWDGRVAGCRFIGVTVIHVSKW